jgi:hypothetical protein
VLFYKARKMVFIMHLRRDFHAQRVKSKSNSFLPLQQKFRQRFERRGFAFENFQRGKRLGRQLRRDYSSISPSPRWMGSSPLARPRLGPRLASPAVKILLPATGMAVYTAP